MMAGEHPAHTSSLQSISEKGYKGPAMKNTNNILLIFIMMIALSACQAGTPPAQVDLESSTWVLTNLAGTHPIEGSTITLQFKDGQISGNAGCNHYGGGFIIEGQTISFSDIYATEMYCTDLAGIMDQEQSYLAALANADRFEMAGDRLTITTNAGQTLVFEKQQVSTTPVVKPTIATSPTPTVEVLPPTVQPVVEIPQGFKAYQDPVVGISIYIPETWVVTGIIEGQYAILQSYPVDKYIGGEMRETGDTKCDLSIQPPEVDMTGYIDQLKAAPTVTVVSEQQITLQSGMQAMRFEIDSMGRSILFLTQLKQRTIVLNCFGDFSQVDQIAATLHADE
jgi:heat shock protein HslJ